MSIQCAIKKRNLESAAGKHSRGSPATVDVAGDEMRGEGRGTGEDHRAHDDADDPVLDVGRHSALGSDQDHEQPPRLHLRLDLPEQVGRVVGSTEQPFLHRSDNREKKFDRHRRRHPGDEIGEERQRPTDRHEHVLVGQRVEPRTEVAAPLERELLSEREPGLFRLPRRDTRFVAGMRQRLRESPLDLERPQRSVDEVGEPDRRTDCDDHPRHLRGHASVVVAVEDDAPDDGGNDDPASAELVGHGVGEHARERPRTRALRTRDGAEALTGNQRKSSRVHCGPPRQGCKRALPLRALL